VKTTDGRPSALWRSEPERYVLPNGTVVACTRGAAPVLQYNEIFTQRVYCRHGIAIDDGACVIDAGANIGIFSMFACQSAPGVGVYAFEPVPRTFSYLQANLQAYGSRVRLFDHGLSDADEMVRFATYPNVPMLSTCHIDRGRERRWREWFAACMSKLVTPDMDATRLAALVLERRDIDCRVRPLSSVIVEQQIASIDLLKIDVEGSELDVLHGIASDHWRRVVQVVVEVHTVQAVPDVSDLLRAKGYAISAEPADDDRTLVYATRRA